MTGLLETQTPPDRIRITVLGSGTSSGVPTIGCTCAVCQSQDPRDNRLRPSILLRYYENNGDETPGAQLVERSVIIDTTPDFRQQVLRAGLMRLDAILYTHGHADHILGLDDVRPFNYFQKSTLPLYASGDALAVIRRVFAYAFSDEVSESSSPKLAVHEMDGQPFDLFGMLFTPIRLEHGRGLTYGFRFGRAAYLTDHSAVPDSSRELLHGLDLLFVDALRHRPHKTHTTVADAVALVEQLQPERAFFTHMSHDLGHAETEASLPAHIRLAYDGLELEVARAAPDGHPDPRDASSKGGGL